MSRQDDLSAVVPAETPASFGVRGLALRPLRVGAIPQLVRVARPVIEALVDGDLLVVGGELVDIKIGSVLNLIADHGDAIFQAVSIATGVPADELANGDIDEFVVLVQRAVEVNRDFFSQKLAPLLAGLARARLGDGPTPSSS